MAPVVPKLVQVVFDSTDARQTAEFWRQLLGLVYPSVHEPPPAGDDDPEGRDWLNLKTRDGLPLLAVQQVEDLPRTTWPAHDIPQQLHLDLVVDSVEDLDAAHERVLELGGELRFDRSDDPEEPLRVFVDPSGHTFCIFVADTSAVFPRQ